MLRVCHTNIDGCLEMYPGAHVDKRGRFVKPFSAEQLRCQGLEAAVSEMYYSVSSRGVIRGMHFQTPPMDHVKLVCCVAGTVLDVVVDLRVGSPTYLKNVCIELSEDRANSVYIPKGMAHGFCVLSESATLVYITSTEYSAECDSGIRWDSVGIQWPVDEPIVSDRDCRFPELNKFNSPFRYEQK